MVGYYDKVLAALTAAIVAGGVASVHPSVELHQRLAGGSMVSTIFLYEILFRTPPAEPSSHPTAGTVLVGGSWALIVVLVL